MTPTGRGRQGIERVTGVDPEEGFRGSGFPSSGLVELPRADLPPDLPGLTGGYPTALETQVASPPAESDE